MQIRKLISAVCCLIFLLEEKNISTLLPPQLPLPSWLDCQLPLEPVVVNYKVQ